MTEFDWTVEYRALLDQYVTSQTDQSLNSVRDFGGRLFDARVAADDLLITHQTLVGQARSQHAEGFDDAANKALTALLHGYGRSRSDQQSRIVRELSESERRYRALAESAHDSIFIVDLDDRIQYVNTFGARLLGKSAAEVIGIPRSALFRGPAGEEQLRNLRQVIKTGQTCERVNPTSFPDGSVIWLATVLTPIKDDEGKVTGVLGLSRDVTALKSAEAGLRTAHARLEAMLGALPDLLFEIDPDCRILDFRAPDPTRLLYPPEQFLGKKVEELLEAPAVQVIKEAVREALDTGASKGSVYFLETARGVSWHELSIARSGMHEASDVRLVVLIRDITERKQAEEALRQSESKYRSLIESTNDWIWEVDADGVYTYASPQVEDILGYKPEEVIGKTPFNLMPPEEAERLFKPFEESRKNREKLTAFENVCVHKNGSRITLETNGSPFFDSEGRILGYRGVDRDITDRKKAQENLRFAKGELEIRVAERTAALQTANQKLRDQITERIQAEENARRWRDEVAHMSRMAVMGEMATGIAHEINQPLCAVKTFAQGALRRLRQAAGLQDESLLDALGKIAKQAERAAAVVERQRGFAKKGRPRLAAVDLNAAVMHSLEFIDHELREQSARVNLALASALPQVCADSVQLMQVLLNILRNALDSIRSNSQEDRRIDVETSPAGGEAVVCLIRDNGRGCTEDEQVQLFDAFYTTKEDGLGMGLAVSRSIIISHGGRLWATRNHDRGMTFHFTLPTSGNTETP